MAFDVVVVGAGPSGLAFACRLKQLANKQGEELHICVVEKGSEVGAHILSGAVIETRALEELFPNWEQLNAPFNTKVSKDEIYLLKDPSKATKIPNRLAPKTMHNDGNYIVSVGNLCRWLAEQAESLGIEIFPGFAASHIIYNEQDAVAGIGIGDMGLDASGQPKDTYMPGMDLLAKYTIFSEGCRGHLGKEIIAKYRLDADADPQHYGLGIKELWNIDPAKHQPGLVVHGSGWPLNESGASGGFFLYHGDNNQVSVGLITDLNYSNTHLSPFDEFQRLKHHPVLSQYLSGGTRISYGARAIAKGGLNSLPKMTAPGAILVGCDAGTLNFSKIKGTHTAMKSGIVAAETVYESLQAHPEGGLDLTDFKSRFKQSWAYQELHKSRNFGSFLHKYGAIAGGALNTIDQNIVSLPFTVHDDVADHKQLKPTQESKPIQYPKPDGVLSFDKLSSVYLSNTNHEENQPCHLVLQDKDLPIRHNLQVYDEAAQRFCPAGVYEVVVENEVPKLQINAQNCLHCKTCDIKDPCQNITWVTPEGAGGPNYPNM
ncbi:MAG: electron transfer flavoprotein-ubiquinone oxidoreductase [Pseudomonadota bacterium]|nr:electron transfer flavoprotein-ubiquinone oxidoreductase [Pseudomonadota bacterium]